MIFKQLIINLGIHCALKMSGCQSFCCCMYPLKMNHQNFTLDSDFNWPFLRPYMGVIPNPKMAFIFPISCILALIFPILIKCFPKCVGKGSFPKSQIKSLLEGTLKKYEWEPWDSGNIQHCTVSYDTSCNSDYNLTIQPNSDKYDVFYDLTIEQRTLKNSQFGALTR